MHVKKEVERCNQTIGGSISVGFVYLTLSNNLDQAIIMKTGCLWHAPLVNISL